MKRLSRQAAGRVALAAQGFHARRPASPNLAHFRAVFDRLGVLQLDSVNVLARSHYLPVFARLGPYDRDALDAYTARSGQVFEYWAHAACLVRSADQPLLRWRMSERKPRAGVRRLMTESPGFVEQVYQQIAERGPLTVAQLDAPGERTGPWWGYAPGKVALEWLFAAGRITAYRDHRFGRLYDLPERVLPAPILAAPTPPRLDAIRALVARSLRSFGVGTVSDLADYYRLRLADVRPALRALQADGAAEPVQVAGWKEPAWLDPEAKQPRTSKGTALLSPFDPVVWNRERAERLFGFHYRIEIYTPAAKRRFGYYVLPFLHRGQLVGRVDLKAHRKERRLEVRAAHIEPGRDPAACAEELLALLRSMAAWLGLTRLDIVDRGDLAPALRACRGTTEEI